LKSISKIPILTGVGSVLIRTVKKLTDYCNRILRSKHGELPQGEGPVMGGGNYL
jgi:hypothetical protein